MTKPKPKRCEFCYKKLTSDKFQHYLTGACLKSQQEARAAKPVGVRKKKPMVVQNQIVNYED